MEASVNIKPKFGRVLIKRELVEKTAAGLYIPETAAKRNAPCVGIIVALGETAGWTEAYYDAEHGIDTKPIQTMNVGDKVIFGRHSGAWLDGTYKDDENKDGTLFICQDQDILAIIKQEAA